MRVTINLLPVARACLPGGGDLALFTLSDYETSGIGTVPSVPFGPSQEGREGRRQQVLPFWLRPQKGRITPNSEGFRPRTRSASSWTACAVGRRW